jgi:uncharacterized membrane protein YkoI
MNLTNSVVLAVTFLVAGCSESRAAPEAHAALAQATQDKEEKIALDAVPQNVKDAALAAVPGLVLAGAEREVEKGVLHYDLEGKANGVSYEVEVTADGKVTEIEKEGDDDDDDDKEDDDGKK